MPGRHLHIDRADHLPHPVVFQGRRFSKWVKIGLPVVSLGILWLLYHEVPILFSSLIVSVGLYYLLNPVVDFLEKNSIRRWAGTALVFLGVFFLIYLIWLRLLGLSAEIREKVTLDIFQNRIVAAIGQVVNRAEEEVPLLKRWIEGDESLMAPGTDGEDRSAVSSRPPESSPGREELKKESPKRNLSEDIKNFVLHQIMARAFDMAKQVASLFFNLVLISFFTFFLLKDGRKFKKNVIEWIPNRYFEPALKFSYELNRRMHSYLQSMLLDCSLVGVMVGVGSYLVGAKFPMVLGLIAFVLNAIPLLGPALYTVLGLILTVGMVDNSSSIALGYLGVCVASRLCDDLIFIPTIYGRSHHLHPVLVITAVLVGESVAGAWGMFLAIPIVSILLLGLQIVREISAGDMAPPVPASAFHPFG